MKNDKMVILDQVYGEKIIDEPAIVELINCKTFQRLKDIDQAGYAPLYNNPNNLPLEELKKGHNRYEHSIGVYLLLRKYNDSFEAQVSGLLHDVSHAVFSHCFDYVFDDEGSQKEQTYQDKRHRQFIKNSEVYLILKKYNLDVDKIICESNFPLLENNIPNLCADRIDYSLREGLIYRVLTKEDAANILENLAVENNQWYFKTNESAQKFAKSFKIMNDIYFSGLSAAIMFTAVGAILKYSYQKGYLCRDDFDQTDSFVLNKIRTKLDFDPELAKLYKNIHNPCCYREVVDNGRLIYCKSRVVDPLIKIGSSYRRLSEVYPAWKEIVENDLKPKKYFLELA